MTSSAVEELIEIVEQSEQFAAYKKEEPDAYLVHIFSMHPIKEEPQFQIGYYSLEKKKLVVFNIATSERLPEDEPFNEGHDVKALDLDAVSIPPSIAEEKALAFAAKTYSAEPVNKVILLLQQLEKATYNFTLITVTFSMLNIRVDASTGEVLQHTHQSLLNLQRSDESLGKE